MFPSRIRGWWDTQSGANRIALLAIAGVLVLGVGLFGAFRFRGPDYAVLFSNLQPDEASAVVQKLDAAKIPHRALGSSRAAAPAGSCSTRRAWG
jgi:flagellar biosynthesis/type III secretory pathway M-ring protein FliF/YscJ